MWGPRRSPGPRRARAMLAAQNRRRRCTRDPSGWPGRAGARVVTGSRPGTYAGATGGPKRDHDPVERAARGPPTGEDPHPSHLNDRSEAMTSPADAHGGGVSAATHYRTALLGGPGFTSGCGGLGGVVVVDGADERLDGGVERLDAAGGAAEDQRALDRRDGQVGQDRGALGGDAQRFEAADQRRPPPREHAVEVGAELLVAGGQLQDHGGDRAAALVAGAFQAAGEDLGERADQRPGVIGVAGGLVDQLLELVARPGDGFAGEFLLAAGEVEVGRSAGRAAFADHVGEGGGVVAALAEQLGGGVEHPGAAVGASGHGPSLPLTYV